jgi:hypothetical protein
LLSMSNLNDCHFSDKMTEVWTWCTVDAYVWIQVESNAVTKSTMHWVGALWGFRHHPKCTFQKVSMTICRDTHVDPSRRPVKEFFGRSEMRGQSRLSKYEPKLPRLCTAPRFRLAGTPVL